MLDTKYTRKEDLTNGKTSQTRPQGRLKESYASPATREARHRTERNEGHGAPFRSRFQTLRASLAQTQVAIANGTRVTVLRSARTIAFP